MQAAKKNAAKKPAQDAGSKVSSRFEAQTAALAKLVDEKGMDLADAAKKLEMSYGKARRLYARASVKPIEQITGTEAQIAAEIVRLHDDEGLAFVPDIWARLQGMSGSRIKELYAQAKKTKRGE